MVPCFVTCRAGLSASAELLVLLAVVTTRRIQEFLKRNFYPLRNGAVVWILQYYRPWRWFNCGLRVQMLLVIEMFQAAPRSEKCHGQFRLPRRTEWYSVQNTALLQCWEMNQSFVTIENQFTVQEHRRDETETTCDCS